MQQKVDDKFIISEHDGAEQIEELRESTEKIPS